MKRLGFVWLLGVIGCSGSAATVGDAGGVGVDAGADVGHPDAGKSSTDSGAHHDASTGGRDGGPSADAGSRDGAADAQGAEGCPVGQRSCGTDAAPVCVTTAADPKNCGACGNACASGQVCSDNQCGATCIGSQSMLCSGNCVDPSSDNANCGTCGDACPAGQVCSGGACAATCSSPYTACGAGDHTYCANTATDLQNCGSCGTNCTLGTGLCTNGACKPPACSPTCSEGMSCGANADCSSGACTDLTCASPNCAPACTDGSVCGANDDCASGVCTNGQCATSVCAPTCADGAVCGANDDCASGVCTNGKCVPPTCSPACTDGASCGANTDCAAGVCTDGKCASAACSPTCDDGAACGANGDCVSGVCTNGKCAVPTCSPTCADGLGCGANTDCASGVCTNAVCAVPTCAPTCADGTACGANGDCGSDACTNGKCASPTCAPNCTVGNDCGANTDCASGLCTTGKCVDTANCAALLAANATALSGFYEIDPAGAAASFIVYCDMTTAPGGWTQVYDQDTTIAPGYQPRASWLAGVHTTGANGGQYSILNLMTLLKSGANYQFRLVWPTAPQAGSLQWTQVENPLVASQAPTISNVVESPPGQVGGFNSSFRGLAPSAGSQPASLNGDSRVGDFWWTVGSSVVYSGGGIPSYWNGVGEGVGTPHVLLYMR